VTGGQAAAAVPPPVSGEAARLAAEASALFAQFGALASAAHTALGQGDVAGLEASLDARARLAERLDPLVAALVAALVAESGKAGAGELLARVREAAAGAAALDAQLVALASGRRAEIRRSLDHLRQGDAATAAYLLVRGTGVRLDLTR